MLAVLQSNHYKKKKGNDGHMQFLNSSNKQEIKLEEEIRREFESVWENKQDSLRFGFAFHSFSRGIE